MRDPGMRQAHEPPGLRDVGAGIPAHGRRAGFLTGLAQAGPLNSLAASRGMPPDGITRRGPISFPGVNAPVELPPPAPDGVTYVVTKTAAALIGVAECTITRWRHLGYLEPVPGSPPRRPLYRWPDVVEAE